MSEAFVDQKSARQACVIDREAPESFRKAGSKDLGSVICVKYSAKIIRFPNASMFRSGYASIS